MIREHHIGIAELNAMTRAKLKKLDCAQVIHYRKSEEKAAVLIPYWLFVKIQATIQLMHEISGEDKG